MSTTPYPSNNIYIPFLNGLHRRDLEKADRAFVDRLIHHGLARYVNETVQIRNASDVGYSIPYDVAISSGKAVGLELP